MRLARHRAALLGSALQARCSGERERPVCCPQAPRLAAPLGSLGFLFLKLMGVGMLLATVVWYTLKVGGMHVVCGYGRVHFLVGVCEAACGAHLPAAGWSSCGGCLVVGWRPCSPRSQRSQLCCWVEYMRFACRTPQPGGGWGRAPSRPSTPVQPWCGAVSQHSVPLLIARFAGSSACCCALLCRYQPERRAAGRK